MKTTTILIILSTVIFSYSTQLNCSNQKKSDLNLEYWNLEYFNHFEMYSSDSDLSDMDYENNDPKSDDLSTSSFKSLLKEKRNRKCSHKYKNSQKKYKKHRKNSRSPRKTYKS